LTAQVISLCAAEAARLACQPSSFTSHCFACSQ
jgi:hypothetical protein